MRPTDHPRHRSSPPRPRHRFRKSSHSMPTQGDCVEVSVLPGETAVRDSRHRLGGALGFPPGEWTAALTALVAGAFPNATPHARSHPGPNTDPDAEGRPASTGRPT